MSRLGNKFVSLQAGGRKALVPFITAGDPSLEATVPVMHALVAAGADVIELGVPFSDPMADGPVIQRSSEQALRRGAGLRYVLQAVSEQLAALGHISNLFASPPQIELAERLAQPNRPLPFLRMVHGRHRVDHRD